MCGFSGIIFSNRQIKAAFLPGMDAFRKASPRLAHRGDTDHHEAILDSLWLSHFRLAFQDVSSGIQPMRSQDGKHIIIFNGELYNHLELRDKITAKTGIRFKTRSDTETILEGWKAFGESIFTEFDGEFAFVISAVSGEHLVAHRDHYGVKPLFFYLEGIDTRQFAHYQQHYRFSAQRLEFASEIKAITSKKHWNRDGLLRQYVGLYEPIRTPFDHIIQLPPGGTLKATRTQAMFEGVIDTAHQPVRQPVHGQVVASEDALEEVLHDSIADRLLSDVELGIYLSGGVDSKVIAYELSRASQSPKPIKSFTVGFEQAGYDETEEALHFARHLDFDPHVIRIDNAALNYSYPRAVETSELVQPYTNGAAKWWLSLFARQYVQGVFTGDGADEVFCGYPSYRYVNWWKFVMRGRGQAHTAAEVDALLSQYPLGTSPRDGLYVSRFSAHGKNPWLSGSSAEGDGSDFINSIRVLGVAHPLFGQVQAIATALLGEDEAITWLRAQASSVQSWFTSGLPEMVDKICDPENALLLWQNYFARTHLPVLILNWVGDRMEMANTLEGRTPFLSKRLSRFMFGQPDHALVSGLRDKIILRRTYARRFPAEFAHTPKKQFNAPFLDSAQLVETYKTSQIFEQTGLANNTALLMLLQQAEQLSESNPYLATHLRTVYQTAISMSIVHDSLVEGNAIQRDTAFEGRYLAEAGPVK